MVLIEKDNDWDAGNTCKHHANVIQKKLFGLQWLEFVGSTQN